MILSLARTALFSLDRAQALLTAADAKNRISQWVTPVDRDRRQATNESDDQWLA
jgi:hypothetical protein